MRDGRRRRERANTPARNRGHGTGELGPAAFGTAQQQRGDAGRLGGQLQPAGGGEGDAPGDFGHDPGEATLTQAFFHDEQSVFASCFGVDHAIRMQPGGGEAGRKQVMMFEHPEDGSSDAGQDAGSEQGGSGPVLEIGRLAGNLVQRAERQATPG